METVADKSEWIDAPKIDPEAAEAVAALKDWGLQPFNDEDARNAAICIAAAYAPRIAGLEHTIHTKIPALETALVLQGERIAAYEELRRTARRIDVFRRREYHNWEAPQWDEMMIALAALDELEKKRVQPTG